MIGAWNIRGHKMEMELIFQYDDFFRYDEYLMTVGPVIQEYAVIPEGVELWSTRGPFYDLLEEPQMGAVEMLFRELGIDELDGRNKFEFKKSGPLRLPCLATFMIDDKVVEAAVPIFCNCALTIEPAVKTGDEIAIL